MGKFGKLIKTLRVTSEKTLREVAEQLGISVSNLSDIEHGRRKPFGQSAVIKFVEIVGGSEQELLMLAAKERMSIEIPTSRGERVNELAFSLARAESSTFEDEEIQDKINKLLEALKKKGIK
jgi:transcriptional regulator with XRE-family HTH domain